MNGLRALIKKELSDYFSSYRFLILFTLIAMVSLITAYMAGVSIADSLEGMQKPQYVFLLLFTSSGIHFSLVQFVAFFGPLIGLLLGFDTINRERNEGTLSKLLSQPIYRDSVINGKFFAGVIVISIMMISIIMVISALGLIVIGVNPGIEEFFRIIIYLIISIIYISFWLGSSILFSIIFRSVATSALAALAMWIFFSFFVPLGADIIANAITSGTSQSQTETFIRQAEVEKILSLFSPMVLYTDSTATIIDPLRKTTKSILRMGMMEKISMARFSGPLSLDQSILVVLPYIIILITITSICFAVSYYIFMRQEIRSL